MVEKMHYVMNQTSVVMNMHWWMNYLILRGPHRVAEEALNMLQKPVPTPYHKMWCRDLH